MTYQSWTADSADISTFFIFPSVSQFVMVHLDLNLNAATLTDIWSSTQIQIKVLCYTPIIKTFNFSAAFWDWGYVCVFFFFLIFRKRKFVWFTEFWAPIFLQYVNELSSYTLESKSLRPVVQMLLFCIVSILSQKIHSIFWYFKVIILSAVTWMQDHGYKIVKILNIYFIWLKYFRSLKLSIFPFLKGKKKSKIFNVVFNFLFFFQPNCISL